MTCCWILF